ncbi:GNAT family N-acetyltransferase [Luteococcus sp. Sow4_B9]|uniref:GNAT family N-acetyltransferase n=1 Tax=Luteococcus sp. Sow4_B9 TaxID=3438792 RepID=UPI003F9BED7C
MRWTVTAEPPLTRDVARLLATLPEWFGLPDANQYYVDATKSLENWAVRDDAGSVLGLALTTWHFPHVCEVELMVVHRDHHGRGIGTALAQAVEEDARRRGAALLEVKTLGASHPDVNYARTRHFYERMGFLPLEETNLWGDQNPCLFMVKPLGFAPSGA